MWCDAGPMKRMEWWKSRDGRRQEIAMEQTDDEHRGGGGDRRSCDRRIPAGEFEDEYTDGRSEEEGVCGLSGNKRGSEGGAVGDHHGALQRGGFADTDDRGEFGEGEKGRHAGGVRRDDGEI